MREENDGPEVCRYLLPAAYSWNLPELNNLLVCPPARFPKYQHACTCASACILCLCACTSSKGIALLIIRNAYCSRITKEFRNQTVVQPAGVIESKLWLPLVVNIGCHHIISGSLLHQNRPTKPSGACGYLTVFAAARCSAACRCL